MNFVDFLNHGTLPFAGRSDLRHRLIAFWSEGAAGEGLSVMLLIGEAGIGKTRLVEEGVEGMTRAGGAIVQTRLYPESPTSLVPLLARALWRYAEAHPELRIDADESFGSVLSGLRRLCRLRPTTLIVEDLHLLGGGGVGDLGILLDALSDEPLPVIMTARPLELAARGVLERHAVTELEIPGLDADALRHLWIDIFGGPPSEHETRALIVATAGNPLAVRSALRGAVRSGTIALDEPTRTWRMTLSTEAFASSLERSVALLSEGMAAHLDREEGDAAGAIALLGELVARETAVAMAGGADAVDRLVFKGILKTGSVATPHLQGGDRSRHPVLSFTHSLVHRRFVEAAYVHHTRLINVISEGLPLYSALPFQIVLDQTKGHQIPTDVGLRYIDRALDTALSLDYGPDWKLATMVLDSATHVFDTMRHGLDGRQCRVIEARLVIRRNAILHRNEPLEHKQAMVERMLELTEAPDDDETRRLRLAALVNNSMASVWSNRRLSPEAIERIRSFVAEHPWLRLTEPYLAYLNQVVMYGAIGRDDDVLRRVERETEEMLDDPTAGDDFRRDLRRAVYPDLLGLFDDAGELARRMHQLDQLDRGPEDRYTSGILFCKLTLLEQTGRLNEAALSCTEAISYFRDRAIQLNLIFAERLELMIRIVRGLPFEQGAREADQVCGRVAAEQMAHQRYLFGVQMAIAAAVTGRERECAPYLERFIGNEPLPYLSLSLLMETDSEGLVGTLVEGWTTYDYRYGELLSRLRYLFSGAPEQIEVAAGAIRAIADIPLLRLTDLHARLAVVHTVATAGEGAIAHLRGDVRTIALEALEWLEERSLATAVRALLDRALPFLSRRDVSHWRSRLADMPDGGGRESGGKPQGEVRMLGAIEVDRGDGEPIRPKGIRLKTLLGLMVADRLLESRLGHREFALLVAGAGTDPDDARKTLNLAVHRLREALGHDTITTQGDTPRLNDDLIEVDLWRIDRLLDGVESSVRDGALHRAQPMLNQVLRMWNGEIPFPSLYDEFFEAARDDFESRIRRLVVRLARALMREEDAASAEELLRCGLAAMPDEPELVELLVEALTTLGKRVEAERLRITVDL